MKNLNVIKSLLIISVALPMPAWAAYQSGFYGEVQAALTHRDNVSQSLDSTNAQSDNLSTLTLGGGYRNKIGDSNQLIAAAYVSFNRYNEFDGLDNTAASLGLYWTTQPTPGYDKPWYVVSTRLIRLDYEDSDIREGNLWTIGASANKRLTDTVTGHLGFQHVRRLPQDDDAGIAFDTRSNEIYIGLDFQLTRKLSLKGEYSRLHGDVTYSESQTTAPYAYAGSTSRDPALDRCGPSGCTSWYSWRQSAKTNKWQSGIEYQFGAVSVDLTAEYYDSDLDGNGTYNDWLVQTGVVWTF
ncbi:MAG: hypothetical protein HUJ31_04835 [Pseudomonadales bacterium]|nr:hypothetical protein [Pseudomonadales bacterium]